MLSFTTTSQLSVLPITPVRSPAQVTDCGGVDDEIRAARLFCRSAALMVGVAGAAEDAAEAALEPAALVSLFPEQPDAANATNAAAASAPAPSLRVVVTDDPHSSSKQLLMSGEKIATWRSRLCRLGLDLVA